jgi:hypothetical protein
VKPSQGFYLAAAIPQKGGLSHGRSAFQARPNSRTDYIRPKEIKALNSRIIGDAGAPGAGCIKEGGNTRPTLRVRKVFSKDHQTFFEIVYQLHVVEEGAREETGADLKAVETLSRPE